MDQQTTIPPGTRVTHPTWGVGTIQHGHSRFIYNAYPVQMDTPTDGILLRWCLPDRITINIGTA